MFWLLIAPKCEIWAHLPFCLTTSALLIVWIFISDPVFFFISPKISSKKNRPGLTDLWSRFNKAFIPPGLIWHSGLDEAAPEKVPRRLNFWHSFRRSSTRGNKGRFLFLYVGLAVTQSVGEVTVCVCVRMKMSFSGHKNSSGVWNNGRTD